MPPRILLVRHGATTASAEDRFAGSINVELSEEGRRQAAALGKRLSQFKIAAAYCSPMTRAIDTAAAVCTYHKLTAVQMPGLREIDHGQWEGRVHKEVENDATAQYAQWDADPLVVTPPGGENGLTVLARALPAMREIVPDH